MFIITIHHNIPLWMCVGHQLYAPCTRWWWPCGWRLSSTLSSPSCPWLMADSPSLWTSSSSYSGESPGTLWHTNTDWHLQPGLNLLNFCVQLLLYEGQGPVPSRTSTKLQFYQSSGPHWEMWSYHKGAVQYGVVWCTAHVHNVDSSQFKYFHMCVKT